MDPGAEGEPTAAAQDLLVRALELPEPERDAFVQGSGADRRDRDAVRAMLDALSRAGGRIDGALAAVRGELEGSFGAGDGSVGRYVLLQPIGAGASGDVYLGRQRSPVSRLVAVKVLREGAATPLAAARMRAERQVLAALDHPGIASMLDSGELPDGRPWFAMAFVPGLPVTDFAREHGLDARARVELVVQACAAVEHAHRRGVIHRDLKPANVMVSTDDAGRPRVRVIDFGVAKALDAAFASADARTEDGLAVGTPESMAPEQAEGAPPDVGNDAFSLGTVLHELLADRPPRDGAALRMRGRAGLASAIRAARVDPPSMHAPPGRRVDRDLDAVCLRATAADAGDRYESVTALREDLERWLRGEIPLAARASRVRAAARALRRHWRPAAALAAVMVTLAVATLYASRQAAIARAAERAAERRAQQNARVMAYLAGIIEGADPTLQDGRTDVTVRETLEHAVADLDAGALGDVPAEAAEVRRVLGDAFSGLGRADDALAQYAKALALADAGGVTAAVECAVAVKAAAMHANANRGAEAVRLANRAMAVAARTPDDRALRATALTALADALRVEAQDLAKARACAEEAVAILRDEPSRRDELAAALNNLGIVLQDLGELDAGIRAVEEAVAIGVEQGRDGEYRAMYELHNLAGLERGLGRLEDADRHGRQALALVDRLAGPSHPHRAVILANLALVKRAAKEFAEGEALQREALATLGRAGQGASPDAGIGRLNLSSLLRDQGKLDEAIEEGRAAVAVLDALPGQDAWLRAAAKMALGRALMAARRWPEARPPLTEAWALLEPMQIDPKRRSSGLLALYQLHRDWSVADPAAVTPADVDAWRARVDAFERAHPGTVPASAY
jgi:tetratricopeptide (TPR) repeat protein/tRNA A-37 threonylcarbamoyl transferase component Bud32